MHSLGFFPLPGRFMWARPAWGPPDCTRAWSSFHLLP